MHRTSITTLTRFLSFLLFSTVCTSAVDTITPAGPLKDGDVLVSGGTAAFALGFFSPENSTNRYVGVWYNKISEQTVVWVANRDAPIANRSGVLAVDDRTGNLVLSDSNGGSIVWSTNTTSPNGRRIGARASSRILDSGNLILYSGSDTAWQCFDHPSDTFLPSMRLGLDRRNGLNRSLTSWRSRRDPGIGDYSFRMDPSGLPQFFLDKGSTRLWRSGPWNGIGWSGVPEMKSNFIFKVSFVDDGEEMYVTYSIRDKSIFSRFVLNESGSIERPTWNGGERKWVGFWSAPNEKCENYRQCGLYGNCDPYDPSEFECKCLPGYEPIAKRDWYLRDGSKGCTRKPGSRPCETGAGFVRVPRVKVPDTSVLARVNGSLGLQACEDLCLRNCSCTGYTSGEIGGEEGKGCITWYGELIDMRQFSDGGQDLFIRVDATELAQYTKKSHKSHHKKSVIIVAVSAGAALILLLSFAIYLALVKRRGTLNSGKSLYGLYSSRTSYDSSSRGGEGVGEASSTDLHFFDLKTVVAATDNFSLNNKLGEGGFGSVYKGRLPNGQEVAVKRLSRTSGQGIEEFKNEVSLIARLQHRNLVRLLGCCIQHEEKMLVYEYLPNKGLDYFIFDEEKRALLDWNRRFEIIMGIARGILYLHQDSRLRIVHRDLKASNVLLDGSMNPKISDFGMARIFGGDQIEANTNRVVGTYGYMSPEYAMGGFFSTKSDVFSFGVLLLEIISGRKNSSYYEEDSVNLIGHTWELWKEGKTLEAVDPSLGNSYEAQEILRCFQIGLLCVQESAAERPAMSEICFMLSHETTIPSPNQPAFILRKENACQNSSSASVGASSVNDVTITAVEAR